MTAERPKPRSVPDGKPKPGDAKGDRDGTDVQGLPEEPTEPKPQVGPLPTDDPAKHQSVPPSQKKG